MLESNIKVLDTYHHKIEVSDDVIIELNDDISNVWTQQITDLPLTMLVNLCQPYKWIINCFLIQKSKDPKISQNFFLKEKSGWDQSTVVFWDNQNDFSFTQ